MKTTEALSHFNNSVRNLAGALGISVQAIYSWGDEVPALRAYQIRDVLANTAQLGAGKTAIDCPTTREAA